MAQTGYTPILIYSSTTGGQAPAVGNLSNSTLGSELAINITDGKLFYKDNANAVQVIAWKVTPTTAGGTGLTSYTAGDLLYYATGTTLSKLAIGANTTVLTSSGSAPQWTVQSALSVGTAANLLSNATTGVMQIVGPGAGTTRVMTIPNANFTAARTDAGQTFTGQQIVEGNLIVRGSSGDYTGVSATYGGTDNPLFNFNMNDGSVRYRFNMNSDVDIKFETIAGGVWATAWQVDRVTRNITFNTGNLIQGTAAKGIDFTANTPAAGMTSELLNWYEEGTFTPSLVPGTSGSITLATAAAKYTRVGRAVTVTGICEVDSVSLPVGALLLQGLPFTNSADNSSRSAAAIYATGLAVTATTAIMGRIIPSESQIRIEKFAAGSASAMSGDVQTNTIIQFNLTYFV
jgi:hypothetical protein